jgi:PAS domain S-box-containing protein
LNKQKSKESDDLLNMEDKFYKNLLENQYDGVYYVDRSQRITFWNKGAEKTTG